MIKNPFQLFILQALTIPLVIGVFKLPAEKATLSLAANGIFWFVALTTISYKGLFQKLIGLSGLQFLITAVLPVTLLRILSWKGDFNSSQLLGATGAQWHAYSNVSFMIMLLTSLTLNLWIKFKSVQSSS